MNERRWTRAIWFLAGSVGLVVAGSWAVRLVGEVRLSAARERFASNTGSLSLADYRLPALPHAANAAHWLRAGAEDLQISDSEVEALSQILEDDLGSWPEGTRLAVRQLMEINAQALITMDRAAGLEASTFDFDYEAGFSAPTPPMLELHRAARLLAADLRLAVAEGDRERALSRLEVLDQLSRSLARESFLLASLVHLGVERLILSVVGDLLAVVALEPEIYSDLSRRLADRESAEALARGITGEAAAVLDAVRLRGTMHDSTGLMARLRFWLLEPFQLAALLDSYAELVAALPDPWIETRRRFRGPGTGPRWSLHEFYLTNLLDGVERLKVVELDRQLAAKIVEIAEHAGDGGELPQALEPAVVDCYADDEIVYERSAKGGARLWAPAALELWTREHGGRAPHLQPRFDWQIPPQRGE